MRTCQNMNDPIPPCVPVCRMGCFCQTGYIQNTVNVFLQKIVEQRFEVNSSQNSNQTHINCMNEKFWAIVSNTCPLES